MRSPHPRQVFLGFALVPVLPGFYATIFFAQPWAFPIGLCVSYPSALLVGVPVFLLLRGHGWLDWWAFALGGAACALPATLAYGWVQTPPHLEPFSPYNAFLTIGWGVFSGLMFWLLALCGVSPPTWRQLIGY